MKSDYINPELIEWQKCHVCGRKQLRTVDKAEFPESKEGFAAMEYHLWHIKEYDEIEGK